MFADENREPPSTPSRSSQMSVKQVSISSAIEVSILSATDFLLACASVRQGCEADDGDVSALLKLSLHLLLFSFLTHSFFKDQMRKFPKVSQTFAPPSPISSSPSGDMAKIRAKSPWSDHVAARKRLLGKLLSSQGSKRTIPPPFPVTPNLSQELRLMMRGSGMETEKKQDTAYPSSTNNSTTTSVGRVPVSVVRLTASFMCFHQKCI